MQKELEQNIKTLFQSINRLKKDYDALFADHQNLQKDYDSLLANHRDLQMQKQQLMEENHKTKLLAAIGGNPDHKRLMKNHINRLIKEIDLCMAQIVNNNL